jgi:serine/threonine protein kinase
LETTDVTNAVEKEEAMRKHRQVLELLGSADFQAAARDIFDRHDVDGGKGLDFRELQTCLEELRYRFNMDEIDDKLELRLFKKYSKGGKKAEVNFNEFLEMLLSLLRQNAFNQSDIPLGREAFVTKSAGDIWSDWTKIKQLGEGNFGQAFLARNKNKEERVVKAVKKSRIQIPVEDVEREIIVMRQMDHPHLVRLFHWYEDKTKVYLVLEALKGGTLKDIILEFHQQKRVLKEEWIREVMDQVISALSYCHRLRVIHKDIKDENIMLMEKGKYDKPFASVIDLGVAEMFSPADPQGRECGGTPLTMAPEVWMKSFGPKCDVWSLGCVLFELFTGAFPFMANTLNAEPWIKLHKRGPDWSLVKVSAAGKAACQAMLTFDEDKRPTMACLVQHKWFASCRGEMLTVAPWLLTQLQSFTRKNKVKRTMLLELASQLPMDRSREIVTMFESIDSDRDGRICKKELGDVLALYGLTDKAVVDRLFNVLDVDGNGELSFTELAAGVLPFYTDLLDERVQSLLVEHDDDGKDGKQTTLNMVDDIATALNQPLHLVSNQLVGGKTPCGVMSQDMFKDLIVKGFSRSRTPSEFSHR